MRRSIRMALIGGTAAVLVAGGSTAAAFAATHDDHDSHDGRTSASSAAVKVSKSQAEATATQRYPGARVTETEMEDGHGRQVWEVDLVKHHREYEVTVDATTGKVVTAHQDINGDHGRHADDNDHGEHHDHDD